MLKGDKRLNIKTQPYHTYNTLKRTLAKSVSRNYFIIKVFNFTEKLIIEDVHLWMDGGSVTLVMQD
ncbi:hypothetical protein EFB08_19750 [Rufibacter latericius]|uniref:Uncharacterized protein n=1 Tax=Rufibacter latericius TaxID=2487040 RepID=A0A3M9M9U9_9BACT|nr:hypothetical protein EFB08_19750 [Rufibacter latericius]